MVEQDSIFTSNFLARNDREARPVDYVVMNNYGDNTFGHVFCRPTPIANAMSLIREEPTRFSPRMNCAGEPGKPTIVHIKYLTKKPQTGGRQEPHQDHGYWNQLRFGIKYPEMVTCGVALADCDEENGAVTFVPGSHLLGLHSHEKAGDQTGLLAPYFQEALSHCPDPFMPSLRAGQAVLFHPLTIHWSPENNSVDRDRPMLYGVYGHTGNLPLVESPRHPCAVIDQNFGDDEITERGAVFCDDGIEFLED